MAVELITYSGKTVTPMDDAIVRDVGMGASGVLYGCEASYSGNVITIGSGYGLIKGRLFKVTTTRLTVDLTDQNTRGSVFVRLTLSNSSTPISFLVTKGNVEDADDNYGNDDANYIDGYYYVMIARYTASNSGITSIENSGKKLPVNSPTVYSSTDNLWLQSESATVEAIYNAMPRNSMAFIPSPLVDATSLPSNAYGILEIKKIGKSAGNANSIVFRQTKTGNDYRMYFDNFGEPTLEWVATAKDEEIFQDIIYQSGETDTLTIQGGGFTTSSNTSLRFFVPYSKIKKRTTDVSFVSGTLIARQNGKYIAGSASGSFDLNSHNTTITKKNNGLMVNVREEAGFDDATNNSPVAVYANITVRFS